MLYTILLLLAAAGTAPAEPTPEPHPYSPYFGAGVFPYASPYVNYVDAYPPYPAAHGHAPVLAYVPPPLPLAADDVVAVTAQGAGPDSALGMATDVGGDEAPPPPLRLLVEEPLRPSAEFRTVPLLVVSRESLRTVGEAHVLRASRLRPTLSVKTAGDELVECTPAARIALRPPLPVHALRTRVPFPARIEIEHGGVRVPLEVGALIAPVHRGSFVSAQSPVAVSEVYAVPTRPVELAYLANRDTVDLPDLQAVLVESEDHAPGSSPAPGETAPPGGVVGPPVNVTVLLFPETEAEPVLQVDENDDELVNRNPPQVLAPAGIVQSTQPQSSVEPFHNPKESPVLTVLREEAHKRVR